MRSRLTVSWIIVLATVAALTGLVLGQERPPQGDEYKSWMTDIQSGVQNFTNAYNSMDMNAATNSIDNLQFLFKKVEDHWTKQNKTDAIRWAKETREYMEQAQGKMKLKDIAYSLNLLQLAQKNCKACHGVYKAVTTKAKGKGDR